MKSTLTAILLALGLSRLANADLAAPSLVLSPCRLEHPSHLTRPAAQCGELTVPENPANPGGRQIKLYVARVPAINRRKQPDPLFVLAGGPGMAATTFYTSVEFAFARIRRNRDIILVDQRGTGRSNALNCTLSDDLTQMNDQAFIAEESRRCLQEVRSHADPAFYTTSIAVQDLDRVRAALGYDRINLYGSSYGTRVAQHYVRKYPERSRSVILDGVVPPELDLGPAIALDAESALLRIFARCNEDPECHRHFGDPNADYQKLQAQLKSQPVSLTLPDPTTGESTKLELTALHLGTVLRLVSYSADEAAFLPLILHRARELADFTLMGAQFLLATRSLDQVVSYGMHNSVVCSEDVPFFDPTHIDREKIAQTYLGTTELDGLQSVCEWWPRGPVDVDFHASLHSNTPALLLSGSDDPVTPPEYGAQALRGFSQGLHIILQGFGHGQLVAPCMDRVMDEFIEHGSTRQLDISCTRLDKPAPFFISLNGPAP